MPETDYQELSSNRIHQAAQIINDGGVVVYPTRSLYGLGVDIFNAKAVRRIYSIKKRPEDKPLSVLVKNRKALDALVKTVSTDASALIECFWPGKLTLVLEASAIVPDHLTAGTGKIGVRCPGYPVASALVKAAGHPITATSANLSGHAGCAHISELDASVRETADMILDGGMLCGGTGSTVVDVTADYPVILREGSITTKKILAALRK
jgi:L-threonylcarbamoyladenylate synthase